MALLDVHTAQGAIAQAAAVRRRSEGFVRDFRKLISDWEIGAKSHNPVNLAQVALLAAFLHPAGQAVEELVCRGVGGFCRQCRCCLSLGCLRVC